MRNAPLILSVVSALVLCAPALALQEPQPLEEPPLVPEQEEGETPEEALPTDVAPLTRADVEAWLDGFLPYALADGGIAGAVVVVVADEIGRAHV